MTHTEDWLELAQELNAVRSAATPDLWDRFARAIERIHEQIDEQADYQAREFRSELNDRVTIGDRTYTAVNLGATSRCQ